MSDECGFKTSLRAAPVGYHAARAISRLARAEQCRSDADNTSSCIVAGLFEEIAEFGEASIRRIYEISQAHA